MEYTDHHRFNTRLHHGLFYSCHSSCSYRKKYEVGTGQRRICIHPCSCHSHLGANYLHFLFIYHTDAFFLTCTAILAPHYVTTKSIVKGDHNLNLYIFSMFREADVYPSSFQSALPITPLPYKYRLSLLSIRASLQCKFEQLKHRLCDASQNKLFKYQSTKINHWHNRGQLL